MRPVNEATRVRARELIAAGHGRNAIARELGIGAASVSAIAKAAGRSFDRSATAVAVIAANIDRAARRGRIIDRLYSRTEGVLDVLESGKYVYFVNGADGVERIEVDHPPARDERDLSVALAGYLAQATRLELVDSDSGTTDAVSVVDGLMSAFKGAVRMLDAGPPPDEPSTTDRQ